MEEGRGSGELRRWMPGRESERNRGRQRELVRTRDGGREERRWREREREGGAVGGGGVGGVGGARQKRWEV